MESIFCYKVATSWHYRLGCRWRDMSNVRKIGSWQYFCKILKKNVVPAFVFYCDAKLSGILRGSSHVRCYLLIHGTTSLRFYFKGFIFTRILTRILQPSVWKKLKIFVNNFLKLPPLFSVPIPRHKSRLSHVNVFYAIMGDN